MARTGLAAISLSVEANPNPVQPGETVNVTITASNSESTATAPLSLQLTYPASLEALYKFLISNDASCTSGTYCQPACYVNWTLGSIPAGTGVTVTLPPIVDDQAADGTPIEFIAELTVEDETVAEASGTVSVLSAAAFDIAIDESVDPVIPGESMTYVVNYSNRSYYSALNTSLSFPLPEGVTLVDASGGGVNNGGTVSWDLETLPPRQSGRQEVTVSVGTGVAAGTILEVDSAVIEGSVQSIPHSSAAMASTRVETDPSLDLTFDLNPSPAQPGEIVKAGLTVANTGDSQLYDVTLQLRFPELLDSLHSNLITDDASCSSGTYCATNYFVNWDLGNIPAGTGMTVMLPPTVSSGAPEQNLIRFAAKASEGGGRTVEASGTLAVQSEPAFDIAIDETVDPVSPGETMTYVVTYANRSDSSAQNAILSFPLPEGVELVKASGGAALADDTVSWNLQTFAPRQSDRQEVTVSVGTGVAPGTILQVDSAVIEGSVSSLDHSSRAMACTRVENDPPLALAFELNPNPAQPGETVKAGLTVTNIGESRLYDVNLQLRYPESMDSLHSDFITNDAACSSGTYCNPNYFVDWDLGSIPAGTGVTVMLPPTVPSDAPEQDLIRFAAKASEGGGRTVEASSTITVQSERGFNIAVDENAEPISAGTNLVYTITYTNLVDATASDIALSFPLPDGVDFWCATGDATFADGVVEWDLPALGPGEGGQRELIVSPNSKAFAGKILQVDSVEITGTVGSAEHSSSAMVSTRVESANPLALSFDLDPNPAWPEDTVQTSLTVANVGASTLYDVSLQLRYPEFFDAVHSDLVSDDGTCTSGTYCNSNYFVDWDLGSLPSNTEITVSLPPPISSQAPEGSLIAFKAAVSEGGGSQALGSATVLVGEFEVTPPAGDTEIYVDPGDGCDGNTPCFSSVQAGVEEAASPCGPVMVAVGTYDEDVALEHSKRILIQCGWSADFTSRQTDHPCVVGPSGTSDTVLDGSLTIDHGTVFID